MLKKLNPAKVNGALMALGGTVSAFGEMFIDADATPRLAKYVFGAGLLLVGIGKKGWGMAIVDVFDGDTVPPPDPINVPVEGMPPTIPDQPAARPRKP